jgi:type I restriction enzyme S subunit
MSADYPVHWLIKPLDEVMEAIIDYRGKTPQKTDCGIPLITAKIVKNGRIETPEEFIAESQYSSWMVRGLPRAGDVVVTTEAPLGEIAQLDDSNVALAQRIVTLRGKEGVLNNDYLLYLMQSSYVQDQLESRASGSTVKGIKQSELRKILLPIPPEDEQVEIAKHLKALDKKVEVNRQINQSLEQMAQAIFKYWFIDFDPVRARMVGRQPEGMDAATSALFPSMLVEVEPSIGMMPQGWEAISLYDTAAYVNGAAFKANDFSTDGSGLPIIKIAELKQGVTAQTKFTEKDFQPKYSIDSGDVCYSWSGSPETSLDVFRWLGGPGWLNQHIFKLVCSSQKQKVFAYYLLKHMRPILVQTAMDKQTTGLGHVTVADMKRIKVVYPDSAALEMFYEKVKPLYEQCELLEKQCSALEQLRNSLLPKLLSGEVVVVGG